MDSRVWGVGYCRVYVDLDFVCVWVWSCNPFLGTYHFIGLRISLLVDSLSTRCGQARSIHMMFGRQDQEAGETLTSACTCCLSLGR